MVSDQSFEQFNNVTALSGINLREEGEKLFSGPQKGCQVSKSSRRVVQGEDEATVILQNSPLQGKLAKITSKYGIGSSVKERMRVLISQLIRISKQRVDFEKKRHKALVTLDILHQIEEVNWTVNEDWEKRMAEEEIKRVQTKGGNQVGGDLENDANSSEPSKAYEAKRRVTEILHTAAANVAAQAAVGGDDWTSKWKLMSEKALKKHDNNTGSIPKSQPNEQMISASSHIWPRTHDDGHESEEKETENTFGGDRFQISEKLVDSYVC